MTDLTQTRQAAIELTVHQLQTPNTPDTYDLLTRLCPRGIHDLLPLTLHLAEACGELLARDCGSRDDAIASLQQQLADAERSTK